MRKSIIKFSSLFLLIIGGYYLMITHISSFITNYDHKIMSYNNTYNTNINETNIVETLLDNSEIGIYKIEELNEITSNPFLISLMSGLNNQSEEEIKNDLEKRVSLNMINKLSSKNYDSKIVYSPEGNNILTFTIDAKNIFYKKYLSGESCAVNNSPDEINLEIVSSNIKKKLDELGITKQFAFNITSIRQSMNERYYGNHIYYIEDYTHNIKITYNVLCNEIYSLQIGFKEITN